MNILVTFSILSLINVVLSTFKSIATIKCSKVIASLINAGYFGFYNVVLIFTVADFPLWQKIVITVATNLVGIYIAKWIEERLEKVKLWKYELTIYNEQIDTVHSLLMDLNIPHNYVPNIGVHTLVQIYCSTKEQSKRVQTIARKLNAKLFATNSII